MAAGKPVVASAVDDIPELVQDGSTGLLFPTDNLVELTKALKRLIDGKTLRQEMGATAKKRITSDFDIKAQSSKYAKLYMSLLQIKGRHPLNCLGWESTEGKVL
jgi:glycosyltransferase involved in cell wall biosynthesis